MRSTVNYMRPPGDELSQFRETDSRNQQVAKRRKMDILMARELSSKRGSISAKNKLHIPSSVGQNKQGAIFLHGANGCKVAC
mmetsp:Transcript_85710/g.136057  ORF Transcript_85710/g.136057 Transcript_85710/m.136057 type:complete len:82 (+) Transcript_85710:145-390(+)